MTNTPSAAKHTRGPWQFYADLPSTDPNWHVVTNASRQRVVANVHIESGNKMDMANAHLIAAAPDLLAACEAFIDCLDKGPYVGPPDRKPDALARAAIAKAVPPC